MLSDRERRILAQIESHFSVHDPRFAARMRSPRRTRQTAFLLVALGAWWLSATLVLAALWNVPGAVAVATAVMLAGVVTWRRYRR